jgi:hypothetical protein
LNALLVSRTRYSSVIASLPAAASPTDTATPRTSILGSYFTSASLTSDWIRASAAPLMTANGISWIPQPKSGRMTLSPAAVERTTSIASRMSSSYEDMAKLPSAPMRRGNAKPRPRNSFAAIRHPPIRTVAHPMMMVLGGPAS